MLVYLSDALELMCSLYSREYHKLIFLRKKYCSLTLYHRLHLHVKGGIFHEELFLSWVELPFTPEDKGDKFLRNVGRLPLDYSVIYQETELFTFHLFKMQIKNSSSLFPIFNFQLWKH
jgi:hypothetical protein